MSWMFDDTRERLLRRFVEDRMGPGDEERFEEMCREDPGLADEARTLRDQTRMLAEAPDVEAPRDLEASIMERISRAKPPSRAYAFLFRPRTVRVRVMTGLSLAAAIAAMVMIAVWGGMLQGNRGHDAGAGGTEVADRGGPETSVPGPRHEGDGADGAGETVRPGSLLFAVAVEEAARVILVGDFNGWNEDGMELEDADGDGVWTLEIEASPGRYKYRFLVDGERWLADPEADAQVDDGFGGSDSVRYVL